MVRAAANDIPGVRIIDPNVVAPTFRQLEGQRDYYAFPDTLDVDRYTIDEQTRDAVVAVREINLDGLPDNQRNWLNDHTIYTHGYGFYAAYGNQRSAEGDPVFFEGGGRSSLGEYEPRIYFGELSPTYSVVGAPAGASPREFDFPAGGDGEVAVNNTYAGEGGVPIGSALRRFAYAVKYREANFLLSDAVNGSSRILDHRSPTERVERVAPWLRLDGNVYPAVVEGRVQWIVDGFTTSASYPNSRLLELAEATSDSVAQRSNVVTVGAGQVNYVRNAVKATVDAHDGSVKLYGWDTGDPMLKAWSKAFPGAVRPLSEISGDLMAHIRYPQDLLKVQRELITEYHVTNPGDFYSGSDRWRVPRDPFAPPPRTSRSSSSRSRCPARTRRRSRSPRRSSRRATTRRGARSSVASSRSTPTPAPRQAGRRRTTDRCDFSSSARRRLPDRGRCSTRSRTLR